MVGGLRATPFVGTHVRSIVVCRVVKELDGGFALEEVTKGGKVEGDVALCKATVGAGSGVGWNEGMTAS